MLNRLGRVQFFATLRVVALQAPTSTEETDKNGNYLSPFFTPDAETS